MSAPRDIAPKPVSPATLALIAMGLPFALNIVLAVFLNWGR